MTAHRQIRASYDRDSVVVYQAYSEQIAEPAVRGGAFVAPFSWNRMTWIKPSFLWMMARSHWGQKSGQESILAVRVSRDGWERALSEGALTSFDPSVHGDVHSWQHQFASANVHVQWDPERSLRGRKLNNRAIQVGVSRKRIHDYTSQWVQSITDMTPMVHRIRANYLAGNYRQAKALLPRERVYPVAAEIATRLGIG